MRTVNSIHDFISGEKITFDLPDMQFHVRGKSGNSSYAIWKNANAWRAPVFLKDHTFAVSYVEEYEGENLLYLQPYNFHSPYDYFMIPESELIAKGIIKPKQEQLQDLIDKQSTAYAKEKLQDMKDRWKAEEVEAGIRANYDSCSPLAKAFIDSITSKPTELKPRLQVVEERCKDIVEAIGRVNTANKIIPQEWITELIDLNNWKKQNSK